MVHSHVETEGRHLTVTSGLPMKAKGMQRDSSRDAGPSIGAARGISTDLIPVAHVFRVGGNHEEATHG